MACGSTARWWGGGCAARAGRRDPACTTARRRDRGPPAAMPASATSRRSSPRHGRSRWAQLGTKRCDAAGAEGPAAVRKRSTIAARKSLPVGDVLGGGGVVTAGTAARCARADGGGRGSAKASAEPRSARLHERRLGDAGRAQRGTRRATSAGRPCARPGASHRATPFPTSAAAREVLPMISSGEEFAAARLLCRKARAACAAGRAPRPSCPRFATSPAPAEAQRSQPRRRLADRQRASSLGLL